MIVALGVAPALADSEYDSAIAAKERGNFAEAESILLNQLEVNSKNADIFYNLGMVQAYQKKYEQALSNLKKSSAISPDNADYLLAIASTYSWKGEYVEALEYIEKVKPTNINSELLKARIMFYQGEYSDSINILDTLVEKDANNEGIKELRTQVAVAAKAAKSAGKKWLFVLGTERSEFSRRNTSHWSQPFLQVGYDITEQLSSYIRTENAQRFNTHNEYHEVGGDYSFANENAMYLSLGYTSEATFLPEIRFKAGGEVKAFSQNGTFGDTFISLDFQYDKYKPKTDIKTMKFGIRYQLTEDISIQYKHINIMDDVDNHLRGAFVRLDWQTPLDALRINVGYADSPETDSGITIDTIGKFAGISYDVNDDVTLYVSFSHEDRKNSYIRKTLSTAVSVRF